MNDYDIGQLMQEMEIELISSMKRNLARHEQWEKDEGFQWEQWQAKKIREIRKYRAQNQAIMASYSKLLNKATKTDLKKQFLEGGSKVDKEVSRVVQKGYSLVRGTPSDDFFQGNNEKLAKLINAVNNDMKLAQNAALRKMDDVYRRTIFKAEAFLGSGAVTVDKAIDMATKDFLAKGINCIQYADGRNVNIASYARMAVRTANKRVHLMGEGERRKKWGECLVQVSQYAACSPLCVPWQGRVYIDDVYSGGKAGDGNYPLLSAAISGNLFHPNCRHTMSTFFEGMNEEPELMNKSEVGDNYEKVQREAVINQNIQKYRRLKEGSLDPENKKKYDVKVKEWKAIGKDHFKGAHFKTGNQKSVNSLVSTNFRATLSGQDSNIINEMRRESSPWINLLTDEEKQLIRDYTGYPNEQKPKFYQQLNTMLRGQTQQSDELHKKAETLSIAIRKYTLKNDIVCHRSESDDYYRNFKASDVIRLPGFTSASVVEKAALIGDYRVIILVKKGAHGAYIEKLSNYKNQREFLLDKSSVFRVVSKKEKEIILEVI